MDYKETLLLPQTTFPMRGNLPQNEPLRYQAWATKNIYNKMKQNRAGASESFTLHDGPPYANGHIHIGHALNKILKDIVVKFHYFNGKSVRFTPGWDCHGLPIEQKVEEKIGATKKKELPKSKIRELCRAHAAEFVSIQRDGFVSLGVIADWEKPYLTMDFKFEANIYRELCSIAKQGLLIQRSKPVYWSWAAQTALAEAEVEYEDRTSPSIFVAFKLRDEDSKIIIWTTTPWTLPSNTGISLNPTIEYVKTSDGYIVAAELYESLREQGVVAGDIASKIDPHSLENKIAINPLNNRESRVVLGEHVTTTAGSGAVHTAPGHGEDDYVVGLKYNLDVIMPVAADGTFDETVVRLNLLPNPQEFVGVNVFKANEKILELLGDALLKRDDIRHSYPHCWRTHKPVIFRATKQWFIAMDKDYGSDSSTLRKNAMSAIENIRFYPEWGSNRIGTMVDGRPDWCISRQRDWGVPIAFFRNKKTDEIIFDEKVLNFTAMIFEQHGCDAWYDMSIEQLLYPGSGLNPDDLEKSMDILDVWFDSGSTQYAVLQSRNYDAGSYPADLYLEGSDQHRGWFQSSLLTSLASRNIAPYKAILTHGFTVDEKGEKMSKSKGNVVAPEKVLKEYGSEILRLWVAMSDYQSDLKISDNILKQIAEQYRKLRNTFRIMLANLDGLDKIVSYDEMGELDRWILSKAKVVFDDAHKSFSEYNFIHGMSELNYFIVNELSGIYIDITKDIMYCEASDDIGRRSVQSVMAIIAKSMLGLIAPILTYTADEILENAPSIVKGDMEDVFDLVYEPIADVKSTLDEPYLNEVRERLYEIVDTLKKEKVIKSTLELVVSTKDTRAKTISKDDAESFFVISKWCGCELKDIKGSFIIGKESYSVALASEYKCPRCWKYHSTSEDEACDRCKRVLGE